MGFFKKKRILVFGSNTQGRHGKGMALTAMRKFGAVYEQAKGLQGLSYGIVTKELRPHNRAINLDDIEEQEGDGDHPENDRHGVEQSAEDVTKHCACG